MQFIPAIVDLLAAVIAIVLAFKSFADFEDATKEYFAPNLLREPEPQIVQLHLLRSAALYLRCIALLLSAFFIAGLGVGIATVIGVFIR